MTPVASTEAPKWHLVSKVRPMLTHGLHVDVELNLRSSQTVAFNMILSLNLVCSNAPLDTLAALDFIIPSEESDAPDHAYTVRMG